MNKRKCKLATQVIRQEFGWYWRVYEYQVTFGIPTKVKTLQDGTALTRAEATRVCSMNYSVFLTTGNYEEIPKHVS